MSDKDLGERAQSASQATVALSGNECKHPRGTLEYKYELTWLGVMLRDWLECPACGAQYSMVYRKWDTPPVSLSSAGNVTPLENSDA